MRKLVDSCNSSNPCPAIWETDDDNEVLVQGYLLDSEIMLKIEPPSGESAVRVPRSLLVEFALQLIERGELPDKVAS